MALYLTADGKSVIAGNLYDAQGNDLSSTPLEKLVYAPMAKEVWAKMEKSSWQGQQVAGAGQDPGGYRGQAQWEHEIDG